MRPQRSVGPYRPLEPVPGVRPRLSIPLRTPLPPPHLASRRPRRAYMTARPPAPASGTDTQSPAEPASPASVPDDDLSDFPDVDFDYRELDYHQPDDDEQQEIPDPDAPATDDDISPGPPSGTTSAPGSGETILSMVEEYLKSANVDLVVREHIPLLFIADGAKTANWRNRNPLFTKHWFGAGIPYRYLSHITELGASGGTKGATVDQFFYIIGDRAEDPPFVRPVEEYKGGSIEGLRGGVVLEKGQRRKVEGAIERMNRGYIHIPEFTQIADLGKASGGTVQTIIAWADNGRMAFETIGGGRVVYESEATLIVGLQNAKLDGVEEVVLGWNRRAIYDRFAPAPTERSLSVNRPDAREGDLHLLLKLRAALRAMQAQWAPSSLDYSELKQWLDERYIANELSRVDEQIVYSVAIGHHMVTGGDWAGDVKIKMTDELDRILRRIIWNKGLSRIGADRRGAHDALDVLKDPHLLGRGQAVAARIVERALAGRLSVPEREAARFIGVLVDKGYVVVSDGQSTGGRRPKLLSLRGFAK